MPSMNHGAISYQPMYGKVLDENAETVLIDDAGTVYELVRERMYNSHIVNGYLLTDYADKVYEQKVHPPTTEAVKRAMQVRRSKQKSRAKIY